MKRCSKCGVDKELDQFWFSPARKYHVAACLKCQAHAQKLWAERNKTPVKNYYRGWKSDNRDKLSANQAKWREKNPGVAAERTAKWRSENRERALNGQTRAGRKLKIAAYEAYGGFRCACCGETEEAFLSIDHVNNDGAQHRKTVRIRQIYKWLSVNDYPEGFQVLCMNCNCGKARNGGICPHKSLKVQRLSGNGVGPSGPKRRAPNEL